MCVVVLLTKSSRNSHPGRMHLQAVLLIQTDITSRALMEQRIAALTESQVWPW